MSLLRSLLLTLSTYTRLPLPRVEFREEDMQYVLCFVPLAGVLVGLFFWAWDMLAQAMAWGGALKAAGFTLIPLWVTGGFHMDGFLDTSDALASWQPREKKLDIMKDPHMGAFAVIRGGMYLLAMLALYSEVNTTGQVIAVALGFVLSRCVAILMCVVLPNARGSGMIQRFQQAQHRKAVCLAAGLFAFVSLTMGYIWAGPLMLLGAAAAGVVGLWFYAMAQRQFGGITGDLAGYLVQMAELGFAAGVVFLGRLL
ncbi:MAG: adenosylcobinamide-GDP ribazoletransferase [Christensenellales bacterium]|jgi:adenosylcobinamide-GDP ribazoletransferase